MRSEHDSGQYFSDTDKPPHINSPLYNPLLSGNSIRVLRLASGNFSDAIICQFFLVDIGPSRPSYDVLSYVWGPSYLGNNDREKTTIECDGHRLTIQKSLETALRHIRSSSTARILWVDAICINQEDKQERSHQVTLMRKLYRNARNVVIWLGSEPTGNDISFARVQDMRAMRAFGAVCELVNRWLGQSSGTERAQYRTYSTSRDSTSRRVSCFEKFDTDPWGLGQKEDDKSLLVLKEMRRYCLGSQEQQRSDMKCCKEHLSSPKLWIAYSSTDPQKLKAINASGNVSKDFGLDSSPDSAPFAALWQSLADLYSSSWFWKIWVIQEAALAQSAVVRWGNVEINWSWIGLASAILRTNYDNICQAMQISGVYNAYLIYRLSGQSGLSPPQLSFLQLVRLTRQFEATDSRDRIYGLLGIRTLDNDPDQSIFFVQPDYACSALDLFRGFAQQVISVQRTWRSSQVCNTLLENSIVEMI